MKLQPTVKGLEEDRGRKSFKGSLRAAVLSTITVALAGACTHPRSTPESATPTSETMTAASKGATATSHEIWPAMIGQQITVRGKVALGKIGWFISLDNQQEIYFFPKRPSESGSYAEMQGTLVTATGILWVFSVLRIP